MLIPAFLSFFLITAHAADPGVLTQAVSDGDAAKVRELVRQGADVNAADKDGETPLMEADNFEVSDFLIKKGAKVNAVNPQCGCTALMYMSEYGKAGIAGLLLDHGAQVNAANKSGVTSLMHAADGGYEAVASVLLGRGAAVDAVDEDGMTPLMHAATSGHPRVAELLLRGGAKVDLGDKDGDTALWYAAEEGDVDVARVLVGHGADVNAADKKGDFPLARAVVRLNPRVAYYLLGFGAHLRPNLRGAEVLADLVLFASLAGWIILPLLERQWGLFGGIWLDLSPSFTGRLKGWDPEIKAPMWFFRLYAWGAFVWCALCLAHPDEPELMAGAAAMALLFLFAALWSHGLRGGGPSWEKARRYADMMMFLWSMTVAFVAFGLLPDSGVVALVYGIGGLLMVIPAAAALDALAAGRRPEQTPAS